jgi:hypothetical protein
VSLDYLWSGLISSTVQLLSFEVLVGLGKNKTLVGPWVWLRDQTSKTFQRSNPLTPFNIKNSIQNIKTWSNFFFFFFFFLFEVFNNSNQLLFENFSFLKKFQVFNQTIILIKLLNLGCSIKLIVICIIFLTYCNCMKYIIVVT